MRLNLGCGRSPVEGWVNLDRVQLPGVDVVADLNDCGSVPLPFPDDTFDKIHGQDIIEHIPNTLDLMAELWRIAKPGCECKFALPYGSSDDAWEDPTHVRPYFINSWVYFAQPTYWRADYGYRGDWQPDTVTLEVDSADEDTRTHIHIFRNIVHRQTVTLTAVKPARPCDRDLMVGPRVEIIERRSA